MNLYECIIKVAEAVSFTVVMSVVIWSLCRYVLGSKG